MRDLLGVTTALRSRPAGRSGVRPVGIPDADGPATAGPDGVSTAGLRAEADDPVAQLVRRASAGDADAFAAIYELYAVRIYRFLRMRVQEPRDAEDLLQTTFLRAIEALPRWEARGIPFGAWLFRIARNAAIDHSRGRRTHFDITDATAIEAPGADPAESATLLEGSVLASALAALTPDQRDVIALRFFADLSGPEIARTLGRDPAAVRALQGRALAALRRAMVGLEAPAPSGHGPAARRVEARA